MNQLQMIGFVSNLIFSVIALLKDSPLKDKAELTRDEYKAFVKEVLEKNRKPDGTPWTEDETEAIGDEVEVVARGTIAKLSAPSDPSAPSSDQ